MTTDIGEIPLINMANVMLATLKAAVATDATPGDCIERLMRQLVQVHENAEAARGEIEDRVATALQELVAAGLVEALDGGRFRITPRGRRVLEEHPMGVDETILAEFRDSVKKLDLPLPEIGESAAAALAPKAYLDGYGAYLARRPVTENPHPADMNEHGAWDAGWFEALDEAIESGAGAAEESAAKGGSGGV